MRDCSVVIRFPSTNLTCFKVGRKATMFLLTRYSYAFFSRPYVVRKAYQWGVSSVRLPVAGFVRESALPVDTPVCEFSAATGF